MKKLISMVMAAAMVVSLVPATAFAANTATFKVVNDRRTTEKAKINKTTVVDGRSAAAEIVKQTLIQQRVNPMISISLWTSTTRN